MSQVFLISPKTKAGTLVLSATKGLFRVVGGRISKIKPVILKTSSATIGIRGGIAIISATENGATDATFVFGDRMTVSSGGATQVVTRPGYTVTVAAPDTPPSEPAPATTQQLEGSLTALERSTQSSDEDNAGDASAADDSGGSSASSGGSASTGGNTADSSASNGGEATAEGSSEVPTDEDVAVTQLAELSSNNEPADIAVDVELGFGVAVAVDPSVSEVAEGSSETVEVSQETAAGSNPAISIAGTFSGRYFSNPWFIAATFNSLTQLVDADSARYLGYSDGAVASGWFTASSGSAIFNLPITIGTFAVDSGGTTTPFGSVSGVGFLSPDSDFFFYELTELAASSNRAFLFGGTPIDETAFTSEIPAFRVSAFDLRPDFLNSNNSSVPFIRDTAGGSLTGVSVSQLLIARRSSTATDAKSTGPQFSLGINGQGTAQKSLLVGTIGGIITDSGGHLTGCVSKVVEIGFGASPSGLSFAAVRPRGQGFRRRLADRGFPIHRLCASGFGRKRGAPRGASALFRDTAARSVF